MRVPVREDSCVRIKAQDLFIGRYTSYNLFERTRLRIHSSFARRPLTRHKQTEFTNARKRLTPNRFVFPTSLRWCLVTLMHAIPNAHHVYTYCTASLPQLVDLRAREWCVVPDCSKNGPLLLQSLTFLFFFPQWGLGLKEHMLDEIELSLAATVMLSSWTHFWITSSKYLEP